MHIQSIVFYLPMSIYIYMFFYFRYQQQYFFSYRYQQQLGTPVQYLHQLWRQLITVQTVRRNGGQQQQGRTALLMQVNVMNLRGLCTIVLSMHLSMKHLKYAPIGGTQCLVGFNLTILYNDFHRFKFFLKNNKTKKNLSFDSQTKYMYF